VNMSDSDDQKYNQALDQLAKENYYSEEYEYRWAAKTFFTELADVERPAFKQAFLKRLSDDPNQANVMLAGEFEVPECIPILVKELNRYEQPNQETWILMAVIAKYPDAVGFQALERFIDSAQEAEAIDFLSQMDFLRALPHLRRALTVDHLLDRCLHIFAERKKKTSIEQLVDELALILKADNPGYLRSRFRHCFMIKQEPYNPFSEEELDHLLGVLG